MPKPSHPSLKTGRSIVIGSSNLTRPGLKCEGELCISIHNFNLTKTLIARLSKIYIDTNEYDLWEKIINEYKKDQYNSWAKIIKEFEEKINKYNGESSENQNEAPQPLDKAESKYVQDQALITSTRRKGKFIKLGVTDDIALIDKGTNLVNGREKIDWFYSSPQTIEQAKKDFPEGSLCLLLTCLLLTENKEYQIVEIMPYLSHQENTEGCFVRYKENVSYESDDICEILEKEEYKEIKIAEEEYEKYIERNQDPELEYATLNKFENEVKKMLDDPNYKKGIEKGKKKMQKMQLEEFDELLKITDIDSIKKKLKELKESYSM